MTTVIHILSFNPLRLELPADQQVVGDVAIRLPPVHLRVLDLDLGGAIPGSPHIGADTPLWDITFKVTKPIPLSKLVELVTTKAPSFEAVWKEAQSILDQEAPLVKGPRAK